MRWERRQLYYDPTFTCVLTLREVYHLLLRATQGPVTSVLRLLSADSPTPH